MCFILLRGILLVHRRRQSRQAGPPGSFRDDRTKLANYKTVYTLILGESDSSGFYHFCVYGSSCTQFFLPRSCFFFFFLCSGIPNTGWAAKKKIEKEKGKRPTKRKLHELPYTEMLNSPLHSTYTQYSTNIVTSGVMLHNIGLICIEKVRCYCYKERRIQRDGSRETDPEMSKMEFCAGSHHQIVDKTVNNTCKTLGF